VHEAERALADDSVDLAYPVHDDAPHIRHIRAAGARGALRAVVICLHTGGLSRETSQITTSLPVTAIVSS
jgi:hypothetical protein